MSSVGHGEHSYMLICPLCQWIARCRHEWEDSPREQFCPNDGMPLERVACRHCGAPLYLKSQGVGLMSMYGYRNVEYEPPPFCSFCGHSTAPPQEKQMAKKKPSKKGRTRNIPIVPTDKENNP